LHQDAVGVACTAVLSGRRSGHCGFDGLSDVADAQTHVGDLVAVDPDGLLGCSRFAADADIGYADHPLDGFGRFAGQQIQRIQIEAANFNGQAFLAAQQPVEQELTLRCARAYFHAWDHAGQLLAQVLGDLHVGPAPL